MPRGTLPVSGRSSTGCSSPRDRRRHAGLVRCVHRGSRDRQLGPPTARPLRKLPSCPSTERGRHGPARPTRSGHAARPTRSGHPPGLSRSRYATGREACGHDCTLRGMPSEARFLTLRYMTVQRELTSAVPHFTAEVRPESGGVDPGAAPVATRWTAHDYTLEESALVGAAVRVARSLAADLMGTGISFVLAGADGRELGRFAESAHELDTLDAAVPATAGHWTGSTVSEWDGPQQDGAFPPPGRVHGRRRVYVAAPIRRETEGRVGLVVLAWTRGEPNPLMEPLARLVAHDVELPGRGCDPPSGTPHAGLLVAAPEPPSPGRRGTGHRLGERRRHSGPGPRGRGRDVGPRSGARARPAPRGDGPRPWRTVPRSRRGHPG